MEDNYVNEVHFAPLFQQSVSYVEYELGAVLQ